MSIFDKKAMSHKGAKSFCTIDWESAQRFLMILKGEDPICWQILSDKKEKGKAAIVHGPLDEVKGQLMEAQQDGCGIFVTVNRTDGQGRRTENVLAATAVFVDGDRLPLPETWPLDPHLLVQTSTDHWHAYWPIEPTEDLSAWTTTQKHLAQCLGTDKKVSDPPRVMRVPGFWHQKGEPFLVTLLRCPSPEDLADQHFHRYTLSEIRQAFFGSEPETSARRETAASTTKREVPPRKTQTPVVEWDLPPNIALGVEYLQCRAPVAIEGKGGDATTVSVAAHLKDFGISKERALELMAEHWNNECQPPWSPKDLQKKVENAYTYCQNYAPGEDSPLADFDALPSPEETSPAKSGKKKPQKIGNTYKNALQMLRRADLGLAYNEFIGRYFLTAPELPWQTDVGRELDDPLNRVLRHYLLERYKFEVGKDNLLEAVLTLAREHPFHPVREYLNELEWDGQLRVVTWLSRYLGVEDSPYARGVGAKVLLAAVARIMKPGCKFDNILVLEGKQGSGKSSAVKILAGEPWYSDAPLNRLDEADAVGQIQGIWIQEFGELVTLSKSDIDSLKAFASRAVDRARLPYERAPRDFPRQCVFIGTTNSDAYLRDQTGNRRFWPVRTGTIDLTQLKQDRDQLWAEASTRYRQGESLVLPKELWAAATQEQEDRLAEHPWIEQIRMYLETRQVDRISTYELLNTCLELPSSSQHQAAGKILREIMPRLGWKYKRGVRTLHNGKSVPGAGYLKDSDE